MDDQQPEGYWQAATRPLTSLVFVLPMVVAYQIGSLFLFDGEGAIWAEQILNQFFGLFGVFGQALPAILLVTVLLVRHILEGRAWTVRVGVLAGMAGEAVLWTIPVFVLAGLVQLFGDQIRGLESTIIDDMDWRGRLMIALGAGLYEELLFRLIGITALHLLMVDLLRAPERVGRAVAVIVTSLAFAWYHDPASLVSFVFFALAGGLFGVILLWRGFGIAAAAHALYDVVVLVVLN